MKIFDITLDLPGIRHSTGNPGSLVSWKLASRHHMALSENWLSLNPPFDLGGTVFGPFSNTPRHAQDSKGTLVESNLGLSGHDGHDGQGGS
jgi:hypothetical protein